MDPYLVLGVDDARTTFLSDDRGLHLARNVEGLIAIAGLVGCGGTLDPHAGWSYQR